MEFWTRATKEDYVEFGMATLTRTWKNEKYRRDPKGFMIRRLLLGAGSGVFLAWFLWWSGGRPAKPAFAEFARVLAVAGLALDVLLLLSAALWLLTLHATRTNYAKKYRPEEPASLLRVDAQGVRTTLQDDSQMLFYAWRHVQSLLVSQNLYIFIMDNGLGIFVNKQALAGAGEALLQSIRGWQPVLEMKDLT